MSIGEVRFVDEGHFTLPWEAEFERFGQLVSSGIACESLTIVCGSLTEEDRLDVPEVLAPLAEGLV